MERSRRRHAMLLAMLAGLLPLTVFAVQAGPLVVWNATANTPVTYGACAVGREPEAPPRRRLRAVLARPAQHPAVRPTRLSATRHALLKRVAAVDRHAVRERAGKFSIEGRAIARTLPVGGRGRRLAAGTVCGNLPNGEIFVLIPRVPTSLDGRDLGLTPIRAVIGRVTPLWLPGGRPR